jgi:hypothetical protein
MKVKGLGKLKVEIVNKEISKPDFKLLEGIANKKKQDSKYNFTNYATAPKEQTNEMPENTSPILLQQKEQSSPTKFKLRIKRKVGDFNNAEPKHERENVD